VDAAGGSLVPGLHDEAVDVHVRRAGGHPGDAVGDVVGGERGGSLVDGGGPAGIAAEAHDVVPIAAGKAAKKSRAARQRKSVNG